ERDSFLGSPPAPSIRSCRRVAAAAVHGLSWFANDYFHAFGEFLRAVDDHFVARLQALVDRHVVSFAQTDSNRPHGNRAVFIHQIDEGSGWSTLNRHCRDNGGAAF